ncbi:lysM and putative peptidoglycan-binding domain-containing protein 4 [Ambystoma mexicanum]|uniref:lysM and putative peptidoglycan-binding domain-containing protein 4 n=1 Tax=Ambystoma mexicanum TaxID=8296 RepID=UPI0037E7B5DD
MRLKEGPAQTFQAPVSVHAAQGSHVYMFRNDGSDAEDSSEEEFDVMELRARGKEQQRQNNKERLGDVVLLERQITEEDNLNKLALQYGCKVADIKRVNNFIREQDIYALKSIKIPVKPNGILTDGRGELRPLQPPVSSSGLTLVELPEIEDTSSRGDLTSYFKEIDQNIEAAVQSTEQSPASFSSDLATGFSSGSSPQKSSNSGADCGIRWWNAVLFMLLIGIVLPVFYIVYFKTQEGSGAKETSNLPKASSAHNMGSTSENITFSGLSKTVHGERPWSVYALVEDQGS